MKDTNNNTIDRHWYYILRRCIFKKSYHNIKLTILFFYKFFKNCIDRLFEARKIKRKRERERERERERDYCG